MSSAALPILRTPRLTLRPLTKTDADAIVQGVGNYDVSRWLGRVPYPYRHSDALEFIERVQTQALPIWAIEDADGFIGVVGLDEELGYWLARTAWRKGYGFEAARAVVDHWFSEPGARELPSGHYDENLRSRRVLEALGFVETGQSPRFARSLSQEVPGRDMLLTRDRWQARQGMTLYTPRLTLRPMDTQDAAALTAMTVPDVTRNLSSMPTGMTEDEAMSFITARRFQGVPGFGLAIECDGRMIGGLGFGGTPLNIGYYIGQANWGQGLATEALSAFIPELFDRFPVTRITAEVFEDNPASGAVLRKFGFSETGRDMGTSKARLEPAPVITYAVTRETLRVPL